MPERQSARDSGHSSERALLGPGCQAFSQRRRHLRGGDRDRLSVEGSACEGHRD